MSSMHDQRRDYQHGSLSRSELHADPFEQFHRWMADALALGEIDATAMTLATASPNGRPSARVVLLKHFDHSGFDWFTDTSSQKGQELAANPQAELLFFWRPLERQVRIHGQVEPLPASEVDRYFASRPKGSRLSAAASHQSSEVSARQTLLDAVDRLSDQYEDAGPPRPTRWGGYRLQPSYFEFWQGRTDRLHDRFSYRIGAANNTWAISRLSP